MSAAARGGLAVVLLGWLAACSERIQGGLTDGAVAAEVDTAVFATCNRATVPVVDALQCTPLVVTDDDTLPDVPDAGRCEPGRALACRCADGDAGIVPCNFQGYPSECFCDPPGPTPLSDGGLPTPPPHPPRLVAPLSGMRVTSRRPTLRWAPPAGVQRARVELCDDRACTRRVTQAEVSGNSWRPAELLRPGVLFWRVTGLRAEGTSTWTSATWEFGVRHRDTPTDSASGPIRDFNGDGQDDVVLNSSFSTTLIPGGEGGLPAAPIAVIGQRRQYGLTNSTIGDIDGDGGADMVMALTVGAMVGPAVPSVRLFWSAPGCPFRSSTRVDPILEDPTENFGSDVAICDFDGDGFGDLIVTGAREVTIYRGGSRSLRWHDRTTLGGIFLRGVSGVGDVDGDGFGDVMLHGLSSPTNPSEVRVLFGNARGRLDERVQSLTTMASVEVTRNTIADDFSGDGHTDLIVQHGAMLDLYWGSEDGLRLGRTLILPGRVYQKLGSNFGDLDGDGRSEVLQGDGIVFSASFSMEPASVVRFTYSGGSFSKQDPTYFGFGFAGDLNGDGFDEFLSSGQYSAPPSVDGGGAERVSALALHLGGASSLCRPARMWGFNLLEHDEPPHF